MQGAEAIITINDTVTKERIKKDYRIQPLDESLRKFRTKREAKVLKRLEELDFPAPRVIHQDTYTIQMELIDGNKLRDVLDENFDASILGELIGTLHNNQIIHGDLTTSNMIFSDKLYLIDFGLSFFSAKVEDMAVDLHLLKQALFSKHHLIAEQCFQTVLASYTGPKNALHRLQKVESRGRNKGKSGP
ncbi:MAG: KEOPS complex kinase/ATPase Bud32 [Candidatus Woesearchaeota archaeon]